jgi:hypothetical protein
LANKTRGLPVRRGASAAFSDQFSVEFGKALASPRVIPRPKPA